MENDSHKKVSQEDIARWELAFALSKEVVEESSIQDISEYISKDYDGLNFTLYKNINGEKVTIYAEVGTEFGMIKLECPLVWVTNNLLLLIKRLLSDETVSEVLKPTIIFELRKLNIDVLTLFNLKESEVEEDIKEKTKDILNLFIYNIPFFARYSIIDALSNSTFGYFHHVVKRSLNKHWENLGLQKDFNIILNSEVDEIREYNTNKKKYYLGDKKQLLTEEKFLGLADAAEELRIKYSEAKSTYFKLKDEFFDPKKNIHYNKNISDFKRKEQWLDQIYHYFPDLIIESLELIEKRPPAELARIHLSAFYGYDEETMRTKIKNSRRLKRGK